MTVRFIQANYADSDDVIVGTYDTGDGTDAPTKQVQLQVDDGHALGHVTQLQLATILESMAGAIRRTAIANT